MMTTISFSQNAETGKYEATYSGESGALHVERGAVGKFYVYVDTTGSGVYTLAEGGEVRQSIFDRFLDMSYAKTMKLVSDSAVSVCKVNTDK